MRIWVGGKDYGSIYAHTLCLHTPGFPGVSVGKESSAMWETWVQSPGWEAPLEEGMATHSSILAWRIPMNRGAWWATVHGTTKSWTRLTD